MDTRLIEEAIKLNEQEQKQKSFSPSSYYPPQSYSNSKDLMTILNGQQDITNKVNHLRIKTVVRGQSEYHLPLMAHKENAEVNLNDIKLPQTINFNKTSTIADLISTICGENGIEIKDNDIFNNVTLKSFAAVVQDQFSSGNKMHADIVPVYTPDLDNRDEKHILAIQFLTNNQVGVNIDIFSFPGLKDRSLSQKGRATRISCNPYNMDQSYHSTDDQSSVVILIECTSDKNSFNKAFYGSSGSYSSTMTEGEFVDDGYSDSKNGSWRVKNIELYRYKTMMLNPYLGNDIRSFLENTKHQMRQLALSSFNDYAKFRNYLFTNQVGLLQTRIIEKYQFDFWRTNYLEYAFLRLAGSFESPQECHISSTESLVTKKTYDLPKGYIHMQFVNLKSDIRKIAVNLNSALELNEDSNYKCKVLDENRKIISIPINPIIHHMDNKIFYYMEQVILIDKEKSNRHIAPSHPTTRTYQEIGRCLERLAMNFEKDFEFLNSAPLMMDSYNNYINALKNFGNFLTNQQSDYINPKNSYFDAYNSAKKSLKNAILHSYYSNNINFFNNKYTKKVKEELLNAGITFNKKR